MWIRDNKYCMTNGDWLVTKYHVRDKTIYVLRKCRDTIGHFDSYMDAVSHYDLNKDRYEQA